MRRLLAVGLAVVSWCCSHPPVESPAAPAAPPAGAFHRGVNFDHLGGFERDLDPAAAARSMDHLLGLGVTHVSVTPSFFQGRLGDSSFFWKRARGRVDEDARRTLRMLRQRGLAAVLKPHLWLDDWSDGAWRGRIDPSPEAWPAWSRAYRETLLAYAALAAEEGAAGIVIGSELTDVAVGHPRFWRELATDLRAVFPGWLTYAANWDSEFDRIEWWDAVDYIGVDAFWPLTDDADEELTEAGCRARMSAIRRQLAAVSRRFDRPVLLTEIGVKSARRGAHRPWQWHGDDAVDLNLQATFYRAAAAVFAVDDAPARTLAGVYIWKWYADSDWGGRRNSDFTPRGKPAEVELRRWFAGR